MSASGGSPKPESKSKENENDPASQAQTSEVGATAAPQAPAPAAQPAPAPSTEDLGKYMGSTPSTVRLTPGDHTILVEKAGYKAWQRTMTVNPGGIVTIDAALEKLL
ncbi:MAG: PEGA domain-containing protein [Acidobacteriia bacterium]|nr:PEGA domain-containing protein [Terriglobia bacterium]